MTIILFDKLANREEFEYNGSDMERVTVNKTINGVEYEITYEYQFLDKKMRKVFVESKRKAKNEQ